MGYKRFTSNTVSLGLAVPRTTGLLMVVLHGPSPMMLRMLTGVGGVALLFIIYFLCKGYVSEVNLALVWVNIIRGLKDSRHKISPNSTQWPQHKIVKKMKRIGLIKKRFLNKGKINEIIEILTRPGKRSKWTSTMVINWNNLLSNRDKVVNEIYENLNNQTYKFQRFNVFYRNENGKRRVIYASTPKDQIVDTLLDECLKHVFMWKKNIIHPHAYGSISGKGQHELRIKVQKSIKDRKTCYVAVLDTRKYYPTINHEVMKETLKKHIKDKWLLWLAFATIDRMPGDIGMALGLASSNILGHVYHADMDWWITNDLGAQEYYRFCDDMIIISEDKYLLHSIVEAIIERTKETLKQEIKPTWQIIDVTKNRFNFLGAAINTKNAILTPKGRRRIEKMRIRKEMKLEFSESWYNDRNRVIRTWAGVRGGLTGLAIGNLVKYWSNVKYPDFFKRLENAFNYRKNKKKRP